MERPQESESRSRGIPIEILQDILVRLPAKDVVRSSCVSKLWRCIAGDPSFRKLHGAHHAAALSESEALLVLVKREPGRPDEVCVSNLSPGNVMCRVAIPSKYMLMNVCNGFLCLALHGNDQAPAVVCNPITGETLELPKAPPLVADSFDLNGQMCLAVNVSDDARRELRFWVMEPPGEIEDKDDDKMYWDLRYCFDMSDRPFYVFRPRCVWLHNDEMLYYRHGEMLYKHDTRRHSSSSNGGPLLFDRQLELPAEAASYPWNVCGGYRPSLLSPLTFALPPPQVRKRKEPPFEHTLLRAITESKRPIKEPRVGH
ncbi:unnamed protein product [Urochloa decumbens]|uniref:F-box domain-containing protein n=1 Tax=Urochloa decumbens TaxID=240449 RepID=A0ABC8XXW4_9POAL